MLELEANPGLLGAGSNHSASQKIDDAEIRTTVSTEPMHMKRALTWLQGHGAFHNTVMSRRVFAVTLHHKKTKMYLLERPSFCSSSKVKIKFIIMLN